MAILNSPLHPLYYYYYYYYSSDPACTPKPGGDCEHVEPIMADDGSGSDITIPSFLVYKADADKIKEHLSKNELVQVGGDMIHRIPRLLLPLLLLLLLLLLLPVLPVDAPSNHHRLLGANTTTTTTTTTTIRWR